MTYFVTVDGLEVASNLTKIQAINTAKKKYEETKSTLRVGIGKIKYVKGERVYTCLPMHFYL
jgi:hypothetical protein